MRERVGVRKESRKRVAEGGGAPSRSHVGEPSIG